MKPALVVLTALTVLLAAAPALARHKAPHKPAALHGRLQGPPVAVEPRESERALFATPRVRVPRPPAVRVPPLTGSQARLYIYTRIREQYRNPPSRRAIRRCHRQSPYRITCDVSWERGDTLYGGTGTADHHLRRRDGQPVWAAVLDVISVQFV